MTRAVRCGPYIAREGGAHTMGSSWTILKTGDGVPKKVASFAGDSQEVSLLLGSAVQHDEGWAFPRVGLLGDRTHKGMQDLRARAIRAGVVPVQASLAGRQPKCDVVIRHFTAGTRPYSAEKAASKVVKVTGDALSGIDRLSAAQVDKVLADLSGKHLPALPPIGALPPISELGPSRDELIRMISAAIGDAESLDLGPFRVVRALVHFSGAACGLEGQISTKITSEVTCEACRHTGHFKAVAEVLKAAASWQQKGFS